MSNPETSPMPRPEALKKLAQLRIERLKKEEEEEQWISGEELYTEGSSDEDDSALRTKRKTNEKSSKKSSKNVGCKSKKQIREENQKTQSRLLPPLVNLTTCSERNDVDEEIVCVDTDKEEKGDLICAELDSKGLSGDPLASSSASLDDEAQSEISWRPKRGLENENLSTSDDADKAYCLVIAKLKKLNEFLVDEFNGLSSSTRDKIETFNSKHMSYDNTIVNAGLNKLLAYDWNFLQERCDVESALTNMNILDLLLEIIECKQKEVYEKTQNVQHQIRDELRQIISDEPTDNEVINNINGFLHLCLNTENEDVNGEIESLNAGKNMHVAKVHCNQFMDLKLKKCYEHLNTVECAMINRNLKYGNEADNITFFPSEENSELEKKSELNLFLNDDEKQRLQLLLDDDCDPLESKSLTIDKNHVSKCVNETIDYEAYVVDQETGLILKKLNEKIKATKFEGLKGDKE